MGTRLLQLFACACFLYQRHHYSLCPPPQKIYLQWLLKVNVVSISEIGRAAFECELAHARVSSE